MSGPAIPGMEAMPKGLERQLPQQSSASRVHQEGSRYTEVMEIVEQDLESLRSLRLSASTRTRAITSPDFQLLTRTLAIVPSIEKANPK
jgi:hypothetical protein